jgi:probable HAF family extracellular repeat protein
VKFRTSRLVLFDLVLLALLALPPHIAAQRSRYKLIDLGTFGGFAGVIAPTVAGGAENPGRGLSANGIIVGTAETALPDPFAPNCATPNCLATHAYRWDSGALTDLGTLQGVSSDLSSGAAWINDRGWIAGFSYVGGLDPLSGSPASRAVLWKNGQIVDLGNLGEDFGGATALNNHGQVVGFSWNGIPNAVGIFGNPNENRAFLWQNGAMQDLGTLCQADGVCGVDAGAFAVNEKGQIAGVSATNTTPNSTTGIPTVHPFIWDRGTMIDIGTLGGTGSGVDGPTILLNNRGQVAGTSTLEGDMTYHPFLWEHGIMKDLGTLGGDTGFVTWITDAGDVIGTADLPGPSGGQSHHAFLWRNAVKTDLGSLGGSSHAEGINSRGQIVGRSKPTPDSPVQHAFLWENGGPMVDLNTLIPTNSSLLLEEGGNINDRGEIAGRGLPAGCDDVDACGHVFLLIPCDNDTSCSEADVVSDATRQPTALISKTSTASAHALRTRMSFMTTWRERLAQRYPGLAHNDW